MTNNTHPIIQNISDVYAHLLPDFFNLPFPNEELATCDHCPMCLDDKDKIALGDSGFVNNFNTFHPDIKCCTFFPDLPNFLVGAILSTTSPELPEGRQRIEEKITQSEGVTPLFVRPPASYSRSYQQCTDYTFGRNRDLLCPYYDQGGKKCSIWPFWQATCSTYFCKSVEGIAGKIFWDKMNFYLSNVEKKLAIYVLQRLGLSAETDTWASWKDRKVEFYIKSHEIINGLDRLDFDKNCGADLTVALEQVKNAYAEATGTTIPQILKTNPELQYKILPDGKYQYDTGHGSCVLSSKVHGILRFFDGKMNNKQVAECILKEQNIRLPSGFLLKLYKNKILIAPSPE